MKKLLLTLFIGTSLLLTGCSQEELQAKEVLEKSIEAMNEVKSMSMEMDIKTTMDIQGQTHTMDAKSSADVVIEPMAMYQNMDMKDPVSGQSFQTEMYMKDGAIYSYDPQSQQWMKFPDEMAEQILKMSKASQNPTQQLEQLKQFVDDFTFSEEGDSYVLTLTSSDEKFKNLLTDQLKSVMGDTNLEEVMKQVEIHQIY